MFKYSDKQQLGGLEECCKLPSGVWGRGLAPKAFLAYLQARKRTWWYELWLFTFKKTCLFEAKNYHAHYCIANYRTLQDLASRFPGLSRTKVIFQNLESPGNFPIKIPWLSRSVGTLYTEIHCKVSQLNAILKHKYTWSRGRHHVYISDGISSIA